VKHRAKAERIGALLPSVLREAQQRHSALYAVQEIWPKLVGKELAAHTKPVSLRKGRLTVQVDRPGDSFLLNYQRPQLLKRLAAKAPVEELVVRPGATKDKTSCRI